MSSYERFEDDLDVEEPKEDKIEEDSIDFRVKNDFDHIEVSLEDDNANEVIDRASFFFLENNENFRPSWDEVR